MSATPLTTYSQQRVKVRAGWTFLDQGLSSVSNVTVTIAVARVSTAYEFGGYATAYVAYALFLQLTRAISSEPLVVRFSGASSVDTRRAARSGAGVTLVCGAAFGASMMVGGFALGAPIELPAVIIGACLPLLLLQDYWRYTFFADGVPRSAAVNDGLWLVVQVIGFGAASVLSRGSETAMLAAWLVGGVCCSVLGAAQARVLPRLSALSEWLRAHRDLIPRYCAEVLLQRGAALATLYVVGAIVGLTAVGALRGALTLVGPLSTIYVGSLLASVPEMSRLRTADNRPAMRRLAVAISVLLGTLGAAWAIVLLLLPPHWGHALLGSSWASTRVVILPFGLYIAAEGLIVGPWAGLRGLAAAKQSLHARAVVAVATAIFGCYGALLSGTRGAAWGIALGSALAAAVWWLQFVRASGHQARETFSLGS